MMQVRAVTSPGGNPNLSRRSMTGITLPRRFSTPLTCARHLRHLGDVHHLDDLAHLEHGQAVFLVGEREGQILAGQSRGAGTAAVVSAFIVLSTSG